MERDLAWKISGFLQEEGLWKDEADRLAPLLVQFLTEEYDREIDKALNQSW